MSSVMTQTCGWRSSTSATLRRSASEYAAPVGFDGEFRISHLVFGVIAASRSSDRNLKPLFCGQGTGTGVPSHSNTISGYDTQKGAGITTSSPRLIVATIALYSTCLPPELIVICEVS